MRLQRGILYALMALAMVACNSQSEIDSNFLSNLNPTSSPVPTPAPFISNFSFATANASQYNFDATKIDFSNGYAELTSSSQTDNSNVALGFAGGSSTETAFSTATDGNGNSNYVRLEQAGDGAAASDLELNSTWTPAWSNLVGYWKLNDAVNSGTVVDSSPVGTNSGTVASGVTLGAAGKLNTAASFSSGSISLASNITGSAANVTVSVWIYPTNSSSYRTIFMNKGTQAWNATNGYYVEIGNNGTLIPDMRGSGGTLLSSANAVQPNQWTHLVYVYSGTTGYIYVNGKLDTSGPIDSVVANSTNNAFIGNFGGNTSYFSGTIDDVAVWNTALSASAISTIYQHESAKYAGTFTSRVMDGLSAAANWTNFSWTPTLPFFKELPDSTNPASPVSETQTNYSSQTSNLMNGILGLWHLDEASWNGTVGEVTDSSGNGNNGTAFGGLTTNTSGLMGNSGTFGSSYVDLTGLSSTAKSYTFSAWIKSASSGGCSYLFDINYPALIVAYGSCAPGLGYYDGAWVQLAQTALADSKWHHYAWVFNNNTSTGTVYLDGSSVGSGFYVGTNLTGNIYLGAHDQFGASAVGGQIDEVGVWARPLSSAEILELYRRGANRIKYQVRTCTASDCSDDATGANWKGPDNTNQSYFSELNNNTVQSDGGDLTGSDSVLAGLPTMTFANFSGLTVPNHRYFQYRAILESDDTSTNCNYGSGATWCSPELKMASVGPGHFDTTAPTITNKTGASYDTLTSLIETLGGSGCSSGTVYNLSPDNTTWYYWTGAAWGIADGTVSKANPATTITSNLSTFATQVGTGTVYFKVFLQSSGTSACAIDSLAIGGTH